MNPDKADLQKEIIYKTSRSGGKGGQNVNKVSTKVELLFDIVASAFFTDEEKERLQAKLQNRFNKDGLLQVICDEERSQYLNKEIALQKLQTLLNDALKVVKKRKPTKVSKAAKAARVDAKRKQGEKKVARKRNFDY